jgi:hypothetical protein
MANTPTLLHVCQFQVMSVVASCGPLHYWKVSHSPPPRNSWKRPTNGFVIRKRIGVFSFYSHHTGRGQVAELHGLNSNLPLLADEIARIWYQCGNNSWSTSCAVQALAVFDKRLDP